MEGQISTTKTHPHQVDYIDRTEIREKERGSKIGERIKLGTDKVLSFLPAINEKAAFSSSAIKRRVDKSKKREREANRTIFQAIPSTSWQVSK